MKKIVGVFSTILLGLSVGGTPLKAQEAGQGPIVLELFTSQSCSSCPPADKLLQTLAARDNIIALSCPVTYWNHLSWKDTLSQDFCTQRQRDYSSAAGRRNVFTPELVVNGKISVVGSSEGKVDGAIRTNAGTAKSIAITVNGGELDAVIPDLGQPVAVSLVVYRAGVTQSIESGENGGRTVHYTNPVIGIYDVDGDWNGKNVKIDINSYMKDTDTNGFVILARSKDGSQKTILAAGKYSI